MKISKKISYIIFIILFLSVSFFVCKYSDILMDSDQASELILASKLLKEGNLFSKTWYYSTSLRVFDVQLFFMLGLVLFPKNFIYAKIFGIILMLFLMSISYFMIIRQIVDERIAIIFSSLIILPYSFWQEFHIVMSGAYIPYVILVNIGLAITIYLYKKRSILLIILGSIVAFVGGLAGVRMGMVLYAPLFITILLLYILYGKKLFTFIPSFIFYFVGFIINKIYLAKRYFFQDITDIYLNNIDSSLILRTFNDFAIDFGIYYILFIVFVIALVFCIYKYKNFSFENKFILIYFITALIIQILSLILFWVGNGSYFLTLMPISFIIIAIMIDNIKYKDIFIVFVAVIVVLSSIHFSNNAVKYPLRGNYELRKVVEEINKDERLTKGTARFWESNVATVWTNGKIEMWTVKNSDILENYRWLQSTTHDRLPSDYFMIVGKDEVDVNRRDEYLAYLVNKHNKKPIIESENYWVLY